MGQRTPQEIDHLSASSIKSYLGCAKSWEANYLRGLKSPWSGALVRGRVVDELSTRNWRQRAQTGRDMGTEETRAYIGERFRVAVGETDLPIDWGRLSQDETLASTLELADLHMTYHAQLVDPEATQLRFEVPIPGARRTVVGFLDALGRDGTVYDVKTGGRKLAQRDADQDLQATAYAYGLGRPIEFVWLRCVAAKEPFTEIVTSTRGEPAIDWFGELAASVSTLIDAGSYPANPGWRCNFCPLKATCVASLTT